MYLNQRGVVNYNLDLKEAARENRKNPTKAEYKIWIQILCDKQTGYLFLRQKPIDNFILDFYCAKLLLGIEIDGGIHNERQQKAYDEARVDRLNDYGIKVIRYKNNDIINNIEYIRQDILKHIKIRELELNNPPC